MPASTLILVSHAYSLPHVSTQTVDRVLVSAESVDD